MLKYHLLSLLAQQPRHGYELKTAFEEIMGGTWEVNIGQVYSTLGRLERDGLVESEVLRQEVRLDKRVYTLTEKGREETINWVFEPPKVQPLKDEFLHKLLVHQRMGLGDLRAFLWEQRKEYLQVLKDLSELDADLTLGPLTTLVVKKALRHAEADMKWLDDCEEVLTDGK